MVVLAAYSDWLGITRLLFFTLVHSFVFLLFAFSFFCTSVLSYPFAFMSFDLIFAPMSSRFWLGKLTCNKDSHFGSVEGLIATLKESSMTNNAILELLKAAVGNNNGNGNRGGDVKKPDEIFDVPGTDGSLTIGIYKAVHAKTREKSIFFDPRRKKNDGKLTKTMKADQLPALLVALVQLARGLSNNEEWVDPTTRARCAFIADHLDTAVAASASITADATNGASDNVLDTTTGVATNGVTESKSFFDGV